MMLHPIPMSYERFLFVAKENTLVAEISDFGKGFAFERVYDDACDEGLTVVGKTGREVVYAVEEYMKRDGELIGWKLLPAKRSERFLPSVAIYND